MNAISPGEVRRIRDGTDYVSNDNLLRRTRAQRRRSRGRSQAERMRT